MTLGQEFHGFANQLDGAIEVLRKTEAYLYEENMGATAIGTGLTASPGYAESVPVILQKLRVNRCIWQRILLLPQAACRRLLCTLRH